MSGLMFTSCKDDETSMAWAVMSSVESLEFKSNPYEDVNEDEAGQTFTLTSDADWVSEAPEWITVTPSSGHAGQNEVTITLEPNFRDGAEDRPREADVIFKGENSWSVCKVKVRQKGDKFRDLEKIPLSQALTVDNETVVAVDGLTTVVKTAKGLVATDGTTYVYVKKPALEVSVGDKFNLQGEKATDNTKFPFLNGERMQAAGTGTVPTLTPEDITDNLDRTKYSSLTYVSVTGLFDGTSIAVEGQNCSVYPEDPSSEFKLNKLSGHNIQIIGFFAGNLPPVVKVIPCEIVDLGSVNGGDEDEREVYFLENFEWLAPWAAAGKDGGKTPAGSTVETDNLEAAAPQISACKVDGVSAEQAMIDKGYVFHRVTTKTPGECIYLQMNYLKMGKTAYQAGLTLPSMTDVPADTPVVLEFQWCPMRQGSGAIDPVNLIVIVENGGKETTFDVPTHGWADGHKLEWIKATVDLSSVKIDANSKITIRQTQWPLASAHRWFIDNIKIKKAQ